MNINSVLLNILSPRYYVNHMSIKNPVNKIIQFAEKNVLC